MCIVRLLWYEWYYITSGIILFINGTKSKIAFLFPSMAFARDGLSEHAICSWDGLHKYSLTCFEQASLEDLQAARLMQVIAKYRLPYFH